ncbi:putative Histidine kinase [Nitrospira sp. KM1]|uniref:sensor histidine kinase n=1 Tax=Nitrospira sp. KM1 TaxID=1936990 RepID=UPI0013A7A5AB|nr:HAMP domain-containing sensor histidine kinase [Nitrospira sp. KM1]BCA54695.1 putative Histidine kinase [Nitrospira sp. KM1]
MQRLTDSAVVSTLAPIKVAILGAGRGGTALLDLLHQIPSIEIVGISDRDRGAPGLQRARDLHIPVTDRAEHLIGNHGVNLIMDVTGDPTMERFVHMHKRPAADVLSGSASRVLWELVRHESNLQAELFHAEKLAGIGSFAAGIAHDINNPLQLIMGLAENLMDERDVTTIREQAKEIIEAVRRTSAICRDLTQYARRSSVRDDTVVSVNGRLDEALKIARYAASFHDIFVIKHYQAGVEVRGNPDELLHAFVNFITNAVHAMDREGGTLTLTTQQSKETMEVRISDTGCGIQPDTLHQIFEPFFTTKEPGKGTGLGLYNAKTVVNKMHGTISVDSHVGAGTTFTLTFPAVQEGPP